jgi:HEAT repeat protein
MNSPGFPFLEDRIFILLALLLVGLLAIAAGFVLLTVLLRRRNLRETRSWKQLKEKWEPAILEILAEERSPEALAESIRPEDRSRFLELLSLYIRRIRGDEVETLKDLAEPLLPDLVERRKRKAEDRARTVRTVGLLGMPRYRHFLEEALDDPSPLVALTAAESLLQPGQPESVGPVLKRFHRFTRWHPAPLARLLTGMGPDAAPFLRPVLIDSDYPVWVRAVVARALRSIRDVESADLAAEIIESDGEGDLLVECLRLLSEVGESRHREPLIPLVSSQAFPVRAQALRALSTVGKEEDLIFFREALNDPSPWVALEGGRGMAALGGEEELRTLAASDGPVGTVAREVLGE